MPAAERRELVLEAALTEFAAHGFAGASTEDVARVVVTRQSVLENAAPTIVPRKAVRPTEKSA